MSIALTVTEMTRTKPSAKPQQEIQFPVTTTQVLHVARKLAGHNWSTSDIASSLGVKEYQVRSAVFWLVSQNLVRHAGTEYRDLPAPYTGRKYDVKTYTVTDAGMAHEFVASHRDTEVERFGDVAALEMALGFCRAFIRR